MMDWGDGTYEHTAETLVEASEVGVDALGLVAGERVLDLGCGTGNAALAAARRGAEVVAVDPAARLVEVTGARAEEAKLHVQALHGDALAIPFPDDSFDALVSIFAVIFAPDADKATDEMLRVVKRGGRVVLTTWTPRGAIAGAGAVLRKAMVALAPIDPSAPQAPPPWGDEARVVEHFEARGAKAQVTTKQLAFEAASPEAWFAEQEAHHPAWRAVHRALATEPDKWEAIRAESLEHLRAGNLATDKLRVVSDYLVVKAIVG